MATIDPCHFDLLEIGRRTIKIVDVCSLEMLYIAKRNIGQQYKNQLISAIASGTGSPITPSATSTALSKSATRRKEFSSLLRIVI